MGQDLFGKQVLNTYDAIIKVGDNDTLTGIAKQLSDGRGNDAPIWLSTARMGIGITPDTNYTLTVNGAAKIGSLDVTGAVTAASVQLTGGSGNQGLMTWNTDEETVDIVQNGATLQVGQEVQVHVKNQTGALIPDGTPVYVTGTLGSSGRLTVAPMIADGTIEAKYFLGITTEDIGDGEDGKVTTFGKIRGLNTDAYTEGTTLYVSATTAGAWQTTPPAAPNLDLEVAIVINSHVNNGTIFVRATNGQYLGLLHDVYLNSPANNQFLVYNSTTSRWENQGIASVGSINLDTVTDNGNTTTNNINVGDISAGNMTLSGYLRGGETFVIDPSAYGDNTGTVQILGNLIVEGETTTINSTTVTIDDKNLVLASGAADANAANGAGITIDGAAATMTYVSTSDRFVFNKDIETNLVGNADTASTLATARNIEIDGAVTGNADFDGSGDITITTTVNHNHDDRYYTETEADTRFVNVDGDTMTGDLNLNGGVLKVGNVTTIDASRNIFANDITANELFATSVDFEDLFLTNASGGSLVFRNSQGNTVDTENLATVSFQGYYDSAFVGASRIQVKANEDFSATARGTVINFDFWDTGSTYETIASIDSSGLYIGTTNVYDNLPDGITYSDTDNRLKIGVSKNVGSTTETAIQPILLADILNDGFIPYIATGGAGSATVNSRVSDSWLKINSDTLELGASDPVSHEIRYARFLWQSGTNDKISTVYGAKDITASIQYLGGSTTAKIEFTGGSGGGRIQFNDEYTFPATDGTSGQVLTTNGSGDLSWVAAGGPTTSDLQDVTDNGNTTTNSIAVNKLLLPSSHTKLKIGLYGDVGTGAEWIGTSSGTMELSGGSINLNGASGIGTPNLKMGGTTIIDTSRNLTNIGTGGFSSNVTIGGYLDLSSTLYTRSNLEVLNAAGNGWNTWGARDAGTGYYNLTTQAITAGINNPNTQWGRVLIENNTNWAGGTTHFPNIGSTGGNTGSLIMLDNPHVNYRTDNTPSSSFDFRAGLRMGKTTNGTWWDAGMTSQGGDPYYHILNGDNNFEIFKAYSNGSVQATRNFWVQNANTTYTSPHVTAVPVLAAYNTSTASTAHAIVSLRTQGPSGGDPFVSFDAEGVIGWAIGQDTSDSNKFKLNGAWSSLDSNTKITVKTTGEVGIGQTNPQATLEVNGYTAVGVYGVPHYSQSGMAYQVIKATSGSDSQRALLELHSGAGGTKGILQAVGGNNTVYGGSITNSNVVWGNDVGALTFNLSGNASINNTLETEGLFVDGLKTLPNNQGAAQFNLPHTGYNAIRFYETVDGSPSTTTGTIHQFGTSWGGGASVGYLNIDGHAGVNFGAWNAPHAVINSTGLGINKAPAARNVLDIQSDDTSGVFVTHTNNTGFFLNRTYADYANNGTVVEYQERIGVDGDWASAGTFSNQQYRLRQNNVDRINLTGTDTEFYSNIFAEGYKTTVSQFQISRDVNNAALWWQEGNLDTNHVLWNDYYGGPTTRGAAGSGFDGMMWNTYRGIRVRGGLSGAYNLIVAENSSGSTNDHVVKLYAANDQKFETRASSGDGVQIQRDLYIAGSTGGSYGNQLGIGVSNESFPYTLQDTNTRTVIYATGKYPVLTLNSTVTTNTNHGPVIQFMHNGANSNAQWAMGTNGTGSHFQIGYSNTGLGNTNYNSHNGLAGYTGTTAFHLDDSGRIGIGHLGDWGGLGGGNPVARIHLKSQQTYSSYGTYHATVIQNQQNSTSGGANGTGLLVVNDRGNHSWGVVAEFRVDSTSDGDRPGISFTSGLYSGQNWTIGYAHNSGNDFRIKRDHGWVTSSWGTTLMQLDRSGNVTFVGDVTAYSDERLKKDIKTIDNALDLVKQMRGVTYKLKENDKEGVGVIAQEMEKVLPQVVLDAERDVDDEYEIKSVAYGNIVGVLIEAIKEQQAQIDELKSLLNK